MKCVSALSTVRDTEATLADLVGRAADGLGGEQGDLALVFTSMHHADALGRISEEIRSRGLARHVLGCTGESIIGEDREIEGEAALSLWAIRVPGVTLTPRRLTFDGNGLHGLEPSPAPGDPAAARPTLIVLGDPFSFPGDPFLKQVNDEATGVRVVGGMASASQLPGGNRLLLDGETYKDGAVAVEVGGPVSLRTVVSQGCRPIGHTMIVTRAEGNVIRDLGRRPALEVLREVFDGLDPDDQQRVQQGLHIGRVINEYQETFHRGDFLVRNVLGADDAGGIAVTDVIRVGQTVQFHVRDADSADEDLQTMLQSVRDSGPSARVKGALLFSCNGRGTRLFSEPNHDVGSIHGQLGPVPVAGFFAMGELGPVGGQNFVHGFTASIVLFEEGGSPAA
ncbi:MAG: FIST C-terminal domain-containing protein [Planctomycetia bacterium]|nr:FIST C-terminal domain-containing protein [Planctomycetia bacterium]